MTSPDKRTALYRLYAENGTLLYVGITGNPSARFAQHAADKDWWPAVADKTVEWYKTRGSALAAEEAAIKAHEPRHNFEHSTVNTRITITMDSTVSLNAGLDILCRQLGLTRADVFGSLLTRELEARGLLGNAPCYHLFTGVLGWPERLAAPPQHDPRQPCSCAEIGHY